MATPHYSIEDFVYNGMYIPKNTALVLNCYDIHHNEEKYPDSYGPFTLNYARADFSYPQFFVQPRSLHGRYADVFRIEQTPQRHGSGPLGVRRGVSILFLILPDITSVDFFLQICCAVVASVRVSTSQRGSYGLRSHACCGLLISDPYPTSRFPWRNTRASLGARHCLIV